MALATRFDVAIAAAYTGTAETFGTPTFPIAIAKTLGYSSGTGLNAADKVWSDSARSITTAATDSLDLAGGLFDPFGIAVTFVKVKGIYIEMSSANTTIVSLTRPTAGVPIFTTALDSMPMSPGGVYLLTWPSAAAIAVTPTSADLIDLVNAAGATAVIDKIVIVGTSA